MRVYCNVPRRDVKRLRRIGIDSIRALTAINWTKLPQVWARIKTSGGPHIRWVQCFCKYYPAQAGRRGNWLNGHNKHTNEELIKLFGQFKLTCAYEWEADTEAPSNRPEEYHSVGYPRRPWMWEKSRAHDANTHIMVNMVARYYRSELVSRQYKLKRVYWELDEDEEEKLEQAAPYLLFECNPANRGKQVPVFADPPPSEQLLQEARELYRTAPFWLYANDDPRLFLPDDDEAVDPEEEVDEVVDELEPEDDRVDREALEQRKLWAESVLFPQVTDGFDFDRSYAFDPVGEDTDQEEETRARDWIARKAVREQQACQAMAEKWVKSKFARREILLDMLNYDEEKQSLMISEIHRAESRKRIFAALSDPKDPMGTRKVLRDYYLENSGLNPGAATKPAPKLTKKGKSSA